MSDAKQTPQSIPSGLTDVAGRAMAGTGHVASAAQLGESWRACANETDIDRLFHVLGVYGLELEPAAKRLKRLGPDDLPLIVVGGGNGEVALVEQGAKPGRYSCLMLRQGDRRDMSASDVRKWVGKKGSAHSPRPSELHAIKDAKRAATDRLRALNPLRSLGGSRLILVLVAAFISNVLSLGTSLFVMVVYDRVLPNKAVESLYALAAGVALALLFDTLLKRAREGLVETATRNADARVTEDIFDQYVATSNRQSRRSIGELASISRDFETYREFMSTAMILTFVDLPFVFIFIAVIWSIAGLVALVPLVALPAVLFSIVAIQPIVSRASRETSQSAQSRQGLLVEILSGLDTLRVTGAYALMKNRFLSEAARHTRAAQRSKRYHGIVGTIVGMAQQISQVAVIVVGFHLFVSQNITMGAIIAAVILTGRVMGPVAKLGQTIGRGNMALVAYRNLTAFLGAERPTDAPSHMALSARDSVAPAIQVSNVTYRMTPDGPPLFSNLDLTIQRGERVAIVGRTGSGKSTLLRLMNGLVQAEAGTVLLDGAPAHHISRADIHRRVGTVFQVPWLFSGTLFDNVSLGDPEMSEAKANGALAMAGLANKGDVGGIDLSLPIADQGANLSGGERQAVSLARAFAFDPPIYLLDEPSSAMDTTLENRLIEQVRGRLKGQTFVIVTHKARMLDLCDRVIMLERGKVVKDVPMREYRRAMQHPDRPKPPLRRAGPLGKGTATAFHAVPPTTGAGGET